LRIGGRIAGQIAGPGKGVDVFVPLRYWEGFAAVRGDEVELGGFVVFVF
jgi:hypothetical protein